MKKKLELAATSNFNALYGGLESQVYIKLALQLLEKYPYDMFVFEMSNDNNIDPLSGCEYAQVKISGRNLETGELIENKIVSKFESLPIKTFWFKVDDYGEYYVGTFLFPEEY